MYQKLLVNKTFVTMFAHVSKLELEFKKNTAII